MKNKATGEDGVIIEGIKFGGNTLLKTIKKRSTYVYRNKSSPHAGTTQKQFSPIKK